MVLYVKQFLSSVFRERGQQSEWQVQQQPDAESLSGKAGNDQRKNYFFYLQAFADKERLTTFALAKTQIHN